MTGRARREYPPPLPGIARVRIVGDDQALADVAALLASRYVTTAPTRYSGGRAYLDVDTRSAANAKAGDAGRCLDA